MVRILELYTEPLKSGGIEAFIVSALSNIHNDELEFDFFTPYEIENDIFSDSLKRLCKGFYSGKKDKNIKTADYSVFKATKDFLKDKNYDVIHIHASSVSAVALNSLAAQKSGKKIIVHSHSTSKKKRSLKHLVAKALFNPVINAVPDIYCACSVAAGKSKFSKKNMKKLLVLKNGIDTVLFGIDDLKRTEYRRKLGFKDGDRVIGHVGRFAFQKNHEFIIDLFAELHKKSNRYKLLLIGDGELRQSIEEKVNKAGLTDSVIFTGNVNNVQDYMQAMDLFILPSLFEGLGIVGIEAQACGVPCVFSTGVPVEAKLTENVEFIPLEDKTKWIETIGRMILIPKSDNARQIREAGYDIKAMAKFLLESFLALRK